MKTKGVKLGRHELRKIFHDVEIVKKMASVVIEIDKQNNISVCKNLPDYSERLGGTIAVLGPGNINDMYFEKAVILEVGIGPSRPYKQGWISNETGKKWFPKRRKWINIPKEQYLLCAPVIFAHIQKMADARVAKWKCNLDNPFYISGARKYWSHRKKKMYIDTVARIRNPAVRFSVSKDDSFILSDVFYAELETNEALKESLGGLARFIDKRLKRNRNDGYRNFSKLKATEDIRKALLRLPLYLRIEMLDRFLKKTTNRIEIYNDLAQLIGWDFEKTKERQLAEAVLPNPQSRIGDAQIRIITGLDQEKDYVVFEITAKNNN